MIRPFSLYVGLRYTRAKRRNHFISFISLVSMLGIALGVMVLITVLSVMNGFDEQIHAQFFSLAPEVTIMSNQNVVTHWKSLQKRVNSSPQVIDSSPYITGEGMLSNQGAVSGVGVLGVLPREEAKTSQIASKVVQGSFSTLSKSGAYNMVIGQQLSDRLGLIVGDKVLLITPQTTTTPLGVMPQYRRFTVSGIFKTNGGFGFDSSMAYVNLQDAQRLFPVGQGTGGLHVKIKNVYDAQAVSQQLQQMLPAGYLVSNWTEQYGTFFNSIAMEKTIMFVILLLIVAVAAFNLVSTLVMVVNDKRADIAILRTLGASPRSIMAIFIIQGAIVGLIGTFLGVIGGILLSLNATAIVNGIQHIFHVQFFHASVMFVDFLPSHLRFSDVINVAWIALVLSTLATIYPAFIAFRTQPAEALRYE